MQPLIEVRHHCRAQAAGAQPAEQRRRAVGAAPGGDAGVVREQEVEDALEVGR
jgi:hypothetical protein